MLRYLQESFVQTVVTDATGCGTSSPFTRWERTLFYHPDYLGIAEFALGIILHHIAVSMAVLGSVHHSCSGIIKPVITEVSAILIHKDLFH